MPAHGFTAGTLQAQPYRLAGRRLRWNTRRASCLFGLGLNSEAVWTCQVPVGTTEHPGTATSVPSHLSRGRSPRREVGTFTGGPRAIHANGTRSSNQACGFELPWHGDRDRPRVGSIMLCGLTWFPDRWPMCH